VDENRMNAIYMFAWICSKRKDEKKNSNNTFKWVVEQTLL